MLQFLWYEIFNFHLLLEASSLICCEFSMKMKLTHKIKWLSIVVVIIFFLPRSLFLHHWKRQDCSFGYFMIVSDNKKTDNDFFSLFLHILRNICLLHIRTLLSHHHCFLLQVCSIYDDVRDLREISIKSWTFSSSEALGLKDKRTLKEEENVMTWFTRTEALWGIIELLYVTNWRWKGSENLIGFKKGRKKERNVL